MAGHDKTTSEGKAFFKQIEELKKLQVRIGYQRGEKTEANGADLTDIAMFNELGTENTPARPFLRQSVDANAKEIEKFCKYQLQQIANGGTAEQALKAIGVKQVGLVQETILKSKGWAEPNADSTIKKKKGADVPLVDTGTMSQSVHYAVVEKGEFD